MKYLETVTTFLRSLVNPYPLRDWYIAIGLSFVVLGILIGVSVYFFFGIRSGDIVGSLDPEFFPTPNVSREKLEEVVSVYETRRVNYEAGNVRTPDVSDPSR